MIQPLSDMDMELEKIANLQNRSTNADMVNYLFTNVDNTMLSGIYSLGWLFPSYTLKQDARYINIQNEAARYTNLVRLLDAYVNINNEEDINALNGDYLRSHLRKKRSCFLPIILNASFDTTIFPDSFWMTFPEDSYSNAACVFQLCMSMIKKRLHSSLDKSNHSIREVFDWKQTIEFVRRNTKYVERQIKAYTKNEESQNRIQRLGGKKAIEDKMLYSKYSIRFVFTNKCRFFQSKDFIDLRHKAISYNAMYMVGQIDKRCLKRPIYNTTDDDEKTKRQCV